MAGKLEEAYVGHFGRRRWEEHSRAVSALWDAVRDQVMALELPRSQLRIYQDGLPFCGRELQIVREVARTGSANFRLVLDLVDQGAHLEGTEDPALLLREVETMRQLAAVRDPEAREVAARGLDEAARQGLEARDRFVAGRINETLADGECGLLFMGLKHQVEQYLDPDIAVQYLLPQVSGPN